MFKSFCFNRLLNPTNLNWLRDCLNSSDRVFVVGIVARQFIVCFLASSFDNASHAFVFLCVFRSSAIVRLPSTSTYSTCTVFEIFYSTLLLIVDRTSRPACPRLSSCLVPFEGLAWCRQPRKRDHAALNARVTTVEYLYSINT